MKAGSNRIEVSQNELIIRGKGIGKAAKIFLIFLAIVSFLMPLFATVGMVWAEIGFHFAIVICYLLFWGVGVFLTRVFLWNKMGKEVIYLEGGKIRYYADFGYFRDGFKEIPADQITLELKRVEDLGSQLGKLCFSSGEAVLETALLVPIDILQEKEVEIKELLHVRT